MDQTVSGTAAVARIVKRTGDLRAGIPGECSEKVEQMIAPDRIEGIGKDISKTEFRSSEKEVAGIDGTVRHHPKLRCSGWTTDT